MRDTGHVAVRSLHLPLLCGFGVSALYRGKKASFPPADIGAHLSFQRLVHNQEHHQLAAIRSSMKIFALALIVLGTVVHHQHLAQVAGQNADRDGASSFSDGSPVVVPPSAHAANSTTSNVTDGSDATLSASVDLSTLNVGGGGAFTTFRALELPSYLVERTNAMNQG